MRTALISDLHGNIVALRAVLEHIDRGCACILGNHDGFLLDPDLIHRYTESPATSRHLAGEPGSLQGYLLQQYWS
jgi:hypothetical protein